MSDWIKSEDCTQCPGNGYISIKTYDSGEYSEFEKEQCEECVKLVEKENKETKIFNELKELFV